MTGRNLLPMDEELYPDPPGKCVDCGGQAVRGYETCDPCLRARAQAVYERYKREHRRRVPSTSEMLELLKDV